MKVLIALAFVCAASAQVSVYPVDLGPQVIGDQVAFSYRAEGGVEPYFWRVVAGQYPAGLELSRSGSLNGTLTKAGHWSYRLTATDANGKVGSAVMTFDVTAGSFGSRVWRGVSSGESGLWLARSVAIGTQLGDYRTTITCIDNGTCREGNSALVNLGVDPATKRGRENFLTLKIVGPGIIIGGQEALRHKWPQIFTPKAFIPGTWVSAGIQGAIDVHNWELDQKR